MWALNLKGEFNQNITDADLPSNTPFHLNTNDPFMKLTAPGFAAYPNMQITIMTSLYNISSIDLETGGMVSS